MRPPALSGHPRPMRDLRKLVSATVIVSFSIAALMGVIALASGGAFGDTEARVLATTVIVGIESVAVLCYLALAGHRYAVVGIAGAACSAVATGVALCLTWSDSLDGLDVWRVFGVAVTLAASLAQASLLIALAEQRRSLRPGLYATLLAIAVVAVMVVGPIATESGMSGAYWRWFGVIAILDVLGTVVVTALGFVRRAEPGPRLALAGLTPVTEARLVEVAIELGTTPDRLVAEALNSYLMSR